MSVLPAHIIEMLTKVLGNIRFSMQLKLQTIAQWPSGLQEEFCNVNTELLLAVEALQLGL